MEKNKKYTVYCFYHKMFDIDETVQEISKKNIFGINSKIKIKQRKETKEELWERINDHIKKNNLNIINFETIYEYNFWVGGSVSKVTITNNDTVRGYKLFYTQEC